MYFNKQLITVVVILKLISSIQAEYYSSYSEEEIKNPWSAEINSNLTKVNLQYVPRYKLQSAKIRKLKRFDESFYNEPNRNSASDHKLNVIISKNRTNSENNIIPVTESNKDFQFERYFSNPKKGLVYIVNENTPNHITTTQKPLINLYLTRDQHEKEMLQLKQKYEFQCNLKLKNKVNKTKKQEKKKRKVKPSENDSNFVETIGDVLDTIYDTVTNSVTTKVIKKRKNRNKHVSQKGNKMFHAQSKINKVFKKDNGQILEGNNKTEFRTQLELPHKLHSSNNLTSIKLPEQSIKLKTTSNKKIQPFISRLNKVNTWKKISKRSIVSNTTSIIEQSSINLKSVKNSVNSNPNKTDSIPNTHVTNEDNKIETTSTKRISPTLKSATTLKPRKKSKHDSSNDDDYFSFDDFFYDDIEYSEEEKDDLNDESKLSSDSEEYKHRKDFRRKTKTKKKHHHKVLRKYDFFGVFDYLHNFVKPIRRVIRRLIADTNDLGLTTGFVTNDNSKPKNPQNSIQNLEHSDNYENSIENPVTSWFGSWFISKDEDNINVEVVTTEEPGWFDSWFRTERKAAIPVTDDNAEDEEGWFFSWFNSKPEMEHTTTTTTSVPILTISDPMKNPQKWIGILAQHIVNSTAKPIVNLNKSDHIPQKITYENYQIWRLKPNGEEQLRILEDYKNSKEGSKLQWLQGPTLRGLTDVLIPPKLIYDFRGTLNFEGIDYEVVIFDVGKAMLFENRKEKIYFSPNLRYPMNWNTYYSYEEILRFIESIRLKNPTLVEVIHIGRSFEGRPLAVVKIGLRQKYSSPKRNKIKKKLQTAGVVIEAGSYGHEWIGPAATTWIINEIVTIMKRNESSANEERIKKATWYIIPITNPDGYEYSRQFDRMWRKSRAKYHVNSGSLLQTAMTWFQPLQSEKFCFGVDLDRNWDYQWLKHGNLKSSCNEFFAGTSAFSEPETRAVSRFLMDHRKKIKLFISLHAYGQIISYPNKLNTSYDSQKLDDLIDVAMVGVDGLRKSGSNTRFKIDTNGDMVSPKSGSADYFAMFEAGIPFSYTIHLADTGVHGFLLPGSHIESAAKDTFEIIKAMVEYI